MQAEGLAALSGSGLFLSKWENNLKATGSNDQIENDAELKQSCKAFEAVLLNRIFSEMKKTISWTESKDKFARDMYWDMLCQGIADEASNKGTGIAEMLYKQFTPNVQNVANYSGKAGI